MKPRPLARSTIGAAFRLAMTAPRAAGTSSDRRGSRTPGNYRRIKVSIAIGAILASPD